MKRYCLTGALCLFLWGAMSCKGMGHVYAEGAEAYFGTNEGYTWEAGEISPIGFYMASTTGEDLEQVRLLVEYNPRVLELNSTEDEGVTVLEEGKFVLERSGSLGPVFKQIVSFRPLVSASTVIEILSSEGKTASGTVTTETEVYATITIPAEPGCRLTGIALDGTAIEAFQPDKMFYDLSVTGETEAPEITAQAEEGAEVEISDHNLVVGSNLVYITTQNAEGQKALYTLCIDRAKPLTEQTDGGQEDSGNNEEAVLADSEDEEDSISDGEAVVLKSLRKRQIADRILRGMMVLVLVLAGSELALLAARIVKGHEKPCEIPAKARTRRRTRKKEPVGMPPIVIQAEHVCMDFDRAVNEYSSFKELMIQTIKGNRIKEKYRALDNISFAIRKGKVVGVIGTNGAGKSTLLKIISGALKPSSGSIRANRNKIQILTLGTGFDMELTGRENVYLNGAIIGYDKAFIDAHYEEIVEFAELQDFMGEKVKNYSSGMVSRLGFAIATVGAPPEILILDEVLSVGDQIFRKKSLKRIKELIHSGSTVLMVSHSTSTIKENCDDVIWLEKGHMIAMGNAKDICDLYDRYDGDFEKLMAGRENEGDVLEWIG